MKTVRSTSCFDNIQLATTRIINDGRARADKVQNMCDLIIQPSYNAPIKRKII